MGALPSGTVTFLFTDIESSTKLAQGFPNESPRLFARHNEILKQAFESHNGYVFEIVGDSFAVAFQDPKDALAAAKTAQATLLEENWSPAPVKVRMGIHTGSAQLQEGQTESPYLGYSTLALTQRVMSAGHGGQILLSHGSEKYLHENLPEGTTLRDIGRYQLKGINQPENLFQVVADDMDANFPPLKCTPVPPSHRGEVFTLLDHIIRGQLIGREEELSQLDGFWRRAERGEGHLILLSGEPGIGKTRLVEELTALADLRGGLVLEGHFHPELGVTYLGFREALQDYLRSIPVEQARELIGSSAPELVKLVPEVESIIPDIVPNPPMGELEAERLRLFDHVTQFLIRLTRKTPILFVLEDLHWADGPSLMFLHFLLRNTRQLPVLVLGTYRETELDPVRPFYETLLGMNRERLYTRIALQGLDAGKAAYLISALLDGQVEAGLVEAITRDTEGNPFFIEEVVKGLVERDLLGQENGEWNLSEGVDTFIPQSIQIALGKRLDSLSEDGQEALSLASILGREFDMDILLEMSGWDEDRMLDALDEAIKAQLITETRAHGRDTYRFNHILLSQVIYEGINTRRRARFHQQVGEALEKVHAKRLDEQIEPLAFHYARAPLKVAEKAVTYGLRAAEKAVAVYAHDQAIQHYTEVLEALHDLDNPQTEAQALELMGDAKMRLYYVKEALTAYENAVDILEKNNLTESQKYCRLSYKLGELIIREENDPKRAREFLEHALSSPIATPESPQRAKCLATLAVCLVQEGSLDEAQTYAQNAVDLAEKLEFSEGIASGCGALCNVHEAKGDLTSYAQTSELQLAAMDHSGDLYGIYDAYFHMIGLGMKRGDYAMVERYALEGMDVCQKLNAPGWEAPILSGYLIALNYSGRWDEALEHGKRVLPLFDRVGCSSCFMFIFWTLADIEAKMGNLDQAQKYFDNAIDVMSQLNFDTMSNLRWEFFGHVLIEEWDAAYMVAKKYRAAGHPTFGISSTALWMLSSMLPKVYIYAGQIEEAQQQISQSKTNYQDQNIPYGIAICHFATGLIYTINESYTDALLEFEQAHNLYRKLDHPWDIANVLYEMGGVHKLLGDREQARKTFEEALAIFTHLKAQPSMDKINQALELFAS